MTGGAPVSRNTANLARVIAHAGITLVIDVGANLGQYAMRLRRAGYAGRIVSIEPVAEVRDRLAVLAAADPAWTVAAAMALGAEDGTVTLTLSAESDMTSALPMTAEMRALLDDSGPVGRETVTCHRLDAVFDRWAGPDDRVLLKIDTQGTETAVLAGAAGVICRLSLIQTELSLVPVYEGEPDWRQTVDRLAALGFRPVLFLPGYFNRRTARLIGMDGVFARAGDGG